MHDIFPGCTPRQKVFTIHKMTMALMHTEGNSALPPRGRVDVPDCPAVLKNKADIDHVIETYAPAWPVAQMAFIDRNILRLAIFEILFDNKVPVKVVINEAVELAKSFGGDNTPKFINGVLGTVSAQSGKKRR